ALDIRVEYFDIDIEVLGVPDDVLVVLVQRHGAENLGLRLAAHIHAGPLDNEDFHRDPSMTSTTRRTVGARPVADKRPTHRHKRGNPKGGTNEHYERHADTRVLG